MLVNFEAGPANGTSARIWFAPLLLSFCCVAACARVSSLDLLGRHDVNSFLGVHFGRSLTQTEIIHPLGSRETSPYGADAYSLRNVDSGDARYDSVVYEFTGAHGMQMAVAKFEPGSADSILARLREMLGPPQSPAPGATDHDGVTWKTSSGVSVRFDAAKRRLVLVGPYGESLEPDIALRSQADDN